MRRLSISLHIEFGRDEQPERESQTDAMVERVHPDDVSKRAEMDGRRSIGFSTWEDRK